MELARAVVAKNRAGKDGLLFPLNIDTSKSKFEVLDEKCLTLNEAMSQDGNDMKTALQQKWKEIRSSKNV
jgi:hypothetical protein